MVSVMLYPCIVPFIGFIYVFVCRNLSLVMFVLLMLFLCAIVILCGREEHAVAIHLALWYVVIVCHQHNVCKNYVGSVYVGGYGGLSESRLCVFQVETTQPTSDGAVTAVTNCHVNCVETSRNGVKITSFSDLLFLSLILCNHRFWIYLLNQSDTSMYISV